MRSARAHALDFPITGAGPLSRSALSRGQTRFAQVAEAVEALPYGRVQDVGDVSAVVVEQKGTCSSKHRYLAALAHENGHPEVRLMLGLYEMSEENTPGIGPALKSGGLAAIPEAHCYLMSEGQRYDFTGLPAGPRSPLEALIEERVVSPRDLPNVKPSYHRAALAAWAEARGLDADRVWAIRERCIELLANSAPHTDARAISVLHQSPSARTGKRGR